VALTLGTRHVVTGAGQFSIAQPVGLVVAIAGVPSYVARTSTLPVEYTKLAHIHLGTSLGWQSRIDVVLSPQLVYPIPNELTLLRHTLLTGETATIDEIATSSTLPVHLDPWDRNPADWTRAANIEAIGPTGVTSPWTYTVPSGKKLWLASAYARAARLYTGSAIGGAYAQISRNSVVVCALGYFGATPGLEQTAQLNGGPIVLAAGETLVSQYSNADTGGYVRLSMVATGFLFDA
jgi:hypothetical protein